MSTFFIFLYKTAIQLYGWSIKVAAIFHSKAKLWIKGRERLFKKLTADFKAVDAPIIWFHCASLGEFEQGRPLIERLKKEYPIYKILLTFFSPSGYEIRKDYKLADFITYLPLDTPKNAERFIEIVQPKLVFFVKYEFWYFHLTALQKKQIPYYLIAGVFRKNQLFFKAYGQWYLKAIQGFDHLFLQDPSSLEIASMYGLDKSNLAGDPRVDRVVEIAEKRQEIPIIEAFKGSKKLMILGSTHTKDELVFFRALKILGTKKYFRDWKFLIVPHEIHATHLANIEKLSPISTTRYSLADKLPSQDFSMLILDTIGQLSSAYQYGDLAYIGGGFDKGIHNVLEPAVFGLPIMFGPNCLKFKEAKDLIELGGALEILDKNSLVTHFEELQDEIKIIATGAICQQYITISKGATNQILNYLKNKNII